MPRSVGGYQLATSRNMKGGVRMKKQLQKDDSNNDPPSWKIYPRSTGKTLNVADATTMELSSQSRGV
ncbi:putative G-protein coupled receptor [Sesbania bispinosa]|nr:putative G-protein coupled receptor [Sesbania bispinosa]